MSNLEVSQVQIIKTHPKGYLLYYASTILFRLSGYFRYGSVITIRIDSAHFIQSQTLNGSRIEEHFFLTIQKFKRTFILKNTVF